MAIQGVGSGPKYQSSLTAADKVKEAEMKTQKESLDHIQQLEKQVQEARHLAYEEENEIKDQFENRSLEQKSRQEDLLARQQDEGYQRLLELRKKQSEEIARTRKQGEKQLEDLSNYYRNQLEDTTHRNESTIRQQAASSQLQLQSQVGQTKAQEALQKLDAETQKKNLADRNLRELTEMKQKAEKDIEQTRLQTAIENQRVVIDSIAKQDAVKGQYQKDLKRLYGSAQKNIDIVREDTSRRLNRYSSQKEDPFYSTLDLGAQFKDAGDSYLLTALVPEYEQRYVGVTVKGDREIILTGQRRSNETVDKQDGGKQTTSAFQAYSESFKTQFPVDKASLERTFEGDLLVVRVPKLGYEKAKPFQRPAPEAPTIPKPRFPKSTADA